MSSPNHLTSIIEDAFSEYVLVVPDYSPASPNKTYSSASNNSTDLIPTSSNFSLFHNDPYINVMNAYATFNPSPIPILPPIIKPPSESPKFFLLKELLSPKKQKQNQYFQDYKMGESSHDSTLEQQGKQIKEILNHLDELPLDRIERIEDDVEGLDPLGKFDGKGDEGFFIGYYMNRKAFRVFNSRTRIVEETLHITFLENKPNVAGSGPTWLFDIDTLTKFMNYKLVVTGIESNDSAGEARVKTIPKKDYILLPLWTQDLLFSSKADMTNLDTNILVSPILTTKIYKDHPVKQIIRDIHSVPQTRRMTNNVTDHGMFSSVQQRINHKDFQNCPFACFLSQVEPKKLIQALIDPSWIEGYTQEEGIDYDEVFAPVAWIEAIRLFLAYASFKDVVV
nr:retrovirus-related Pol polyprotein from transposon TNT 1-94 [Tanacetum cinerariifolium]